MAGADASPRRVAGSTNRTVTGPERFAHRFSSRRLAAARRFFRWGLSSARIAGDRSPACGHGCGSVRSAQHDPPRAQLPGVRAGCPRRWRLGPSRQRGCSPFEGRQAAVRVQAWWRRSPTVEATPWERVQRRGGPDRRPRVTVEDSSASPDIVGQLSCPGGWGSSPMKGRSPCTRSAGRRLELRRLAARRARSPPGHSRS